MKTLFRSGFNFGNQIIESQEMKIHIIGKLSETIAKRLNFKDTLMIEYERDFYKNRLFVLENDNSNYKILGLKDEVVMKSNGKGAAVRIVDENINVVDILKLVEYSILNRKKINKSLIPMDYTYSYEGDKITVLANSEVFIQNIIQKKSNLINEIIDDEIELVNNGFIQTRISWKNDEFIFGFNEIPPSNGNYIDVKSEKYVLRDFKYYIESMWHNFFVIFPDPANFIYFDGRDENTFLQHINDTVNDLYPFRLGNDIITNNVVLLIPYKDDFFYVYHKKKKLLQKIE
ncbi:MAG: hypothetical protein P0Y62_17800 [Candidatus Chryseobacterium colombiense]|nr:hypothetical protein [Chryseobacterium sp.]WEK69657.1 MAG: hypothetical protein P0Y62_17800 [Chryseobacterium sp.]